MAIEQHLRVVLELIDRAGSWAVTGDPDDSLAWTALNDCARAGWIAVTERQRQTYDITLTEAGRRELRPPTSARKPDGMALLAGPELEVIDAEIVEPEVQTSPSGAAAAPVLPAIVRAGVPADEDPSDLSPRERRSIRDLRLLVDLMAARRLPAGLQLRLDRMLVEIARGDFGRDDSRFLKDLHQRVVIQGRLP